MISFILMLNYYPSIITAIEFHHERTNFAYLDLLLYFMTLYGRSAYFLLVVFPGGLFFSWFISSVAIEDCGAKRKDEINWQRPIKKGIAGFFYPIIGIFLILPYYAVLAIILAIASTLATLSTLLPLGQLGIAIAFVYHVVSFIVFSYIVWLFGSVIGCSISCILVSLASYRYLKDRHGPSEKVTSQVPSSKRLKKQQETAEDWEREEEIPFHELLDYVKKGIDTSEQESDDGK